MAVTSTVIHSVTCGLVKADWLIAVAIILRTPLIGSRVSRSRGASCEARTSAVRRRMTQRRAPTPAAAAWTSSRVIEPDGPEPVSVDRSTPRSLASLRTGGFASARTSLGSACAADGTSASAGAAAGSGRWSTAGTGDSSAGSTSCDWAPPGENAPCTCSWVWAPASVLGEAEPRRARRIGPRSALIRPTRDAPSMEPDAAGLDRSMSAGSTCGRSLSPAFWPSRGRGRTRSARSTRRRDGCRGATGAASPSAPIEMIGVPTGTVSPSATSSARTVPSYGEGSSTSDLAVSISTMTSLISIVSPTLTFHATISASVRPSPTSGRRNSDIRILSEPGLVTVAARPPRPTAGVISRRRSGRRRRARGRGRGGTPPRCATAGRACRTRRRAGPGPRGSRSTPR